MHTFCRTASVDTEVGGIAISAGTKILRVLGAANLDEDHWPDAGRFDIARRPVGHLALGVGIHNCVGQNVARAEGEAVLAALAAKVDAIELTGEPVGARTARFTRSRSCWSRFADTDRPGDRETESDL